MTTCFNNHIAIILAGGQSSRAETTKGLRTLNGQMWVDKQIEFFIKTGIKQVIIGLGYDHCKYLQHSNFLKTKNKQVTAIINKNPARGAFSTLKEVLNVAVEQSWQHAIVIHIDHALPTKKIITEMSHIHSKDVVKPTYKGRSGHPIMISKQFANTLIQQTDDSQLNKEIRKLNINNIKWLVVDNDCIHYNLNTNQQWLDYLCKQ